MELRIRVVARASRNEIKGEREGAVLVRVTAPPVDGRANKAVCRLVAKKVGVAAGGVQVISGEGSRDKTLQIDGVDEAAVHEALGV